VTIKHEIALCLLLLLPVVIMAQTTNDYRSVADGNWGTASIWEYYNGSSWVAAVSSPTYSANIITVQAGDSVTVAANVSVDQLTIESGAYLVINSAITLTIAAGIGEDLTVYGTVVNRGTITQTTSTAVFEDGSNYLHNKDGGVLIVATWNTGSTCWINGTVTGTTTPSGYDQEFYNFIWNWQNPTAVLTARGQLEIVRGDLTYKAGILVWQTEAPSVKIHRIYIYGDFYMEGGILTLSKGNFACELHIYGNVTITGGLIARDVEDSAYSGSLIVFEGDGTQIFYVDESAYPGASTPFSGDIDITVASGSILDVGTSVLGEGSVGIFILAAGATIVTANPLGIPGSIGTTGVTIYSSDATYIFDGTEPQVTGIFTTTPDAGTMTNVVIDNPYGVTLSDSTTVITNLTVIEGELQNVAINNGIDGYFSESLNRLSIAQNGVLMYEFEVITSAQNGHGVFIDRKWEIVGTFTGTKNITFFWSSADDYGYSWDATHYPALYIGEVQVEGGNWSISTPQQITYALTVFPSAKASPVYTIGLYGGGAIGDDTLPVELTSFTVNQVGDLGARIEWVTQSETNVLGFNIYRGDTAVMSEAIKLSGFVPATNTSQTQVYVYYDTEVASMGTYYYWLESMEMSGGSEFFGPLVLIFNNPGQGSPPIPVNPGIFSSSPNPMGEHAKISFGVPISGAVELFVYNIRGQKVRSLVNERKDSGNFHLFWDGRDDRGNKLPSGMYIIRMKNHNQTWNRKISIVK